MKFVLYDFIKGTVMNKTLLFLFAWCCFFINFAYAPVAGAQEEESEVKAGGVLYVEQYSAACAKICQEKAREKNLPFIPSYAFFDVESNSNLCLGILWQGDGSPQSMAYQIFDMKGNLLDALVAPRTSSAVPLESCNVWGVYFDDYNQDKITDITLMIGCFNPRNDDGQNDNVVYLSSVSENSIWLRQRDDVNQAVATITEYAQVDSTIRAVLSGRAYPKPPSSPPPAEPVPETGPESGTCTYAVFEGPESLTFNAATGAVTGTFGEQGGTLAGVKEGMQVRGAWFRGKKKGDFELFHDTAGYYGHWKYSGDTDWRGVWQGKIVDCE